mgnify:CR=1 FL=1
MVGLLKSQNISQKDITLSEDDLISIKEAKEDLKNGKTRRL